jgi:hypothetical protein
VQRLSATKLPGHTFAHDQQATLATKCKSTRLSNGPSYPKGQGIKRRVLSTSCLLILKFIFQEFLTSPGIVFGSFQAPVKYRSL